MLALRLTRKQGDFSLDLSLSAQGGVTALFGPSGSGKSSTLMMVAGLAQPDSGSIRLDDKTLFDAKAGINLPPEGRRIGTVFQDARLFPHLSVRSNLVFGMNRLPQGERKVTFDDVVDILGLNALLDRRPSTLSGGEKQRVAIGRALLCSPKLLLLDEPLAALDSRRKDDVLPFIAALSKAFAIPMLYVSHAMDEVLRLADSLAVIDQGRILAHGSVEDILCRADLRPLTGRHQAGAVIRAEVVAHDIGGGTTLLRFGRDNLRISPLAVAIGTKVRVRIHARDVSLAVGPVEALRKSLSIRNIIPATVVSIEVPETPSENDPLIDVMLDCGGTPLWAQITTLGLTHLGLRPGMTVHALIKAGTIVRDDIASWNDPLSHETPTSDRHFTSNHQEHSREAQRS